MMLLQNDLEKREVVVLCGGEQVVEFLGSYILSRCYLPFLSPGCRVSALGMKGHLSDHFKWDLFF
jgi:hypothetical protein